NRVVPYSCFTDFDINLFKSGNHFKLYEKFGAHPINVNGQDGVYFAVYAPAASKVELIGNFNFWAGDEHQLHVRFDESGIWEGFVPGVKTGSIYKYKITNSDTSEIHEKADPFAFYAERPPHTASIVWKHKKIENQKEIKIPNAHTDPLSIYEIHLPSWKRPWDDREYLSYQEIGEHLIPYILDLGFTHIEFMPVMEFPYDPSWGYQVTGYFAPTSRFGSPDDFKDLIVKIREAGIGVILDWVPSHFPEDKHGLGKFDGSHVYEHPDPRRGFHPDWKSLIFNYGRPEVRSFLISNALFWLEIFGVDGLRVDAVASMLYLDYSREDGEWEPNTFGGNENLEAIKFIKDLNKAVYQHFPNAQLIAEESTSFTGVTKPVHHDGLGFGYKWMMGWMNDTLAYFKKDSIHRKFHQNEITFSLVYAFTENFILPFSHDEVVHGKGSLLSRMPGDDWQKFANLRLLYAYMFTHPGGKLLFMGCEFGQRGEWDFSRQLDWQELQYDSHSGIYNTVKSLNGIYKSEPALHKNNYAFESFDWIDYSDNEKSILVYHRKSQKPEDDLIVVLNFTPSSHQEYRVGVPSEGTWEEVFNSDKKSLGGSNYCKKYTILSDKLAWHGKKSSILIEIPPLSARIFKRK
ncbi:MAG: 1,4-alpha-glucan branching protein GlgB, partial [Bacteroidia bacterium]|nr:1,4-alpha-glucan branching protein GlgB [Bacteroidia bacterium]